MADDDTGHEPGHDPPARHDAIALTDDRVLAGVMRRLMADPSYGVGQYRTTVGGWYLQVDAWIDIDSVEADVLNNAARASDRHA